MTGATLENVPVPTWPPLLAQVREFRTFCAQKRAEVVLQLPAAVLDSFFDARVVEQKCVSNDDDETTPEKYALLVHLPVSGLVWKVALPFFVDLEAPGEPSVGKLRRQRRTLIIQGLREATKKPRTPSWQKPLVVRSLSGREVHKLDVANDSVRVGDLVRSICESTEARSDEVQLMLGDLNLQHDRRLGQCIPSPEHLEELELNLMVVQGPPVAAHASSGARIEVLDGVPELREDCHFDRDYVFTSLGDFASRPRMRYVMTCNEDRKMPADRIMWQLDLRVPTTVYLNFRSQRHVENTGALTWLTRDGWEELTAFRSTVSSGYPNGPYSGPVYAKRVCPRKRKHIVNLMGSNCWEGTYFVFVEPECEES